MTTFFLLFFSNPYLSFLRCETNKTLSGKEVKWWEGKCIHSNLCWGKKKLCFLVSCQIWAMKGPCKHSTASAPRREPVQSLCSSHPKPALPSSVLFTAPSNFPDCEKHPPRPDKEGAFGFTFKIQTQYMLSKLHFLNPVFQSLSLKFYIFLSYIKFWVF